MDIGTILAYFYYEFGGLFMKKSIFVLLSMVFMTSGLFAQNINGSGYPEVDTLIESIPEEINKWDISGNCIFMDSDKTIDKDGYDLFTSFHSGYLAYGDNFNNRDSYKDILSSIKKSVSVSSKGITIRSNPLISYITLGAIYLYSFEMAQVGELAKNNGELEYEQTVDKEKIKILNRLNEMHNNASTTFRDSGKTFTINTMEYLMGKPAKADDPISDYLTDQEKANELLSMFGQYKQMVDNKINALKAEFLKKLTDEAIKQKAKTTTINSAKIEIKNAELTLKEKETIKKNAELTYNNAKLSFDNTSADLESKKLIVTNTQTAYEKATAATPQVPATVEEAKKQYDDAVSDKLKVEKKLNKAKLDMENAKTDLDKAVEEYNKADEELKKKKQKEETLPR